MFRKLIFCVGILFLVYSVWFVQASPDLVDGLISYWKFDDTYFDELDINNGINSGTTFSSGKINNAAVFDSTDKITVGTTGFPSGDSSRSYSMWINPSSVSIYQTVFLTGTYSNNKMFGLVFFDGRRDILSVWGWANDHYGTFVFETGNWYHLVVTYDSSTSTLKTYVNGNIDIDEVTSDFNTVFGIATIGASLTISGRTFNGKIDEFAAWDYALDQISVDELYNSGDGFSYPWEEEDTCTCPGAGNNWEVDLSDFCVLSEACDLTTGKLSFIGSGNFTCNSRLDTTDLGDVGSGNYFWVNSNCEVFIDG